MKKYNEITSKEWQAMAEEIENKPCEFYDIKEGDIFYTTWGWEQTNVEFFQVVKVTKKSVKVRKIKSECTMEDYTNYIATPKKDHFANDKIIQKRVQCYCLDYPEIFISDFQHAKRWDGGSVSGSCGA